LIVVSDTSAMLNLARIGRLELLPTLYQRVLIPPAVHWELTKSSSDPFPAIDFASLPWLILKAAENQGQVRKLRIELGPGEADAIVLAIKAGLTVTGLLGVLVQAKQAGLIVRGKPILDDLIQVARFWIGPDLYSSVLSQLGEEVSARD
jgi:predicted nucleic acid-binding protein